MYRDYWVGFDLVTLRRASLELLSWEIWSKYFLFFLEWVHLVMNRHGIIVKPCGYDFRGIHPTVTHTFGKRPAIFLKMNFFRVPPEMFTFHFLLDPSQISNSTILTRVLCFDLTWGVEVLLSFNLTVLFLSSPSIHPWRAIERGHLPAFASNLTVLLVKARGY
jgi:hypothetical protein